MEIESIMTAAAKELLILGNAGLLRTPAVGIVGSRDASHKGIDAAQDCARQLAKLGVTVVSGYARGVDTVSHKAALEAGGSTILVLAEGIEHFQIKQGIAAVWDWQRALVVSEFPAGAAWSVRQAFQRNGTICELSRAVIVAEARRESGSMNTVRQCLKKKIPLWVVTYENMADFAGGNALAIELGGRPLYKGRISRRAKIDPILELLEARIAA